MKSEFSIDIIVKNGRITRYHLLEDSFEVAQAVNSINLKGKEAVRQWMKENYTEPPVFNVDHFIAENDFVTVIGKITISDAHGQKTAYEYCDVWRFRDGKMVELKAYVIEVK